MTNWLYIIVLFIVCGAAAYWFSRPRKRKPAAWIDCATFIKKDRERDRH